MPQAVRVDDPRYGAEIKQLEGHGEDGEAHEGDGRHGVEGLVLERVMRRVGVGECDDAPAEVDAREADRKGQRPHDPDRKVDDAEANDELGVVAVWEVAEREGQEVDEVRADNERHDGHGGVGEARGGSGCLQVEHTENGVDERTGNGEGRGEVVQTLGQGRVCQSARHIRDD